MAGNQVYGSIDGKIFYDGQSYYAYLLKKLREELGWDIKNDDENKYDKEKEDDQSKSDEEKKNEEETRKQRIKKWCDNFIKTQKNLEEKIDKVITKKDNYDVDKSDKRILSYDRQLTKLIKKQLDNVSKFEIAIVKEHAEQMERLQPDSKAGIKGTFNRIRKSGGGLASYLVEYNGFQQKGIQKFEDLETAHRLAIEQAAKIIEFANEKGIALPEKYKEDAQKILDKAQEIRDQERANEQASQIPDNSAELESEEETLSLEELENLKKECPFEFVLHSMGLKPEEKMVHLIRAQNDHSIFLNIQKFMAACGEAGISKEEFQPDNLFATMALISILAPKVDGKSIELSEIFAYDKNNLKVTENAFIDELARIVAFGEFDKQTEEVQNLIKQIYENDTSYLFRDKIIEFSSDEQKELSVSENEKNIEKTLGVETPNKVENQTEIINNFLSADPKVKVISFLWQSTKDNPVPTENDYVQQDLIEAARLVSIVGIDGFKDLPQQVKDKILKLEQDNEEQFAYILAEYMKPEDKQRKFYPEAPKDDNYSDLQKRRWKEQMFHTAIFNGRQEELNNIVDAQNVISGIKEAESQMESNPYNEANNDRYRWPILLKVANEPLSKAVKKVFNEQEINDIAEFNMNVYKTKDGQLYDGSEESDVRLAEFKAQRQKEQEASKFYNLSEDENWKDWISYWNETQQALPENKRKIIDPTNVSDAQILEMEDFIHKYTTEEKTAENMVETKDYSNNNFINIIFQEYKNHNETELKINSLTQEDYEMLINYAFENGMQEKNNNIKYLKGIVSRNWLKEYNKDKPKEEQLNIDNMTLGDFKKLADEITNGKTASINKTEEQTKIGDSKPPTSATEDKVEIERIGPAKEKTKENVTETKDYSEDKVIRRILKEYKNHNETELKINSLTQEDYEMLINYAFDNGMQEKNNQIKDLKRLVSQNWLKEHNKDKPKEEQFDVNKMSLEDFKKLADEITKSENAITKESKLSKEQKGPFDEILTEEELNNYIRLGGEIMKNRSSLEENEPDQFFKGGEAVYAIDENNNNYDARLVNNYFIETAFANLWKRGIEKGMENNKTPNSDINDIVSCARDYLPTMQNLFKVILEQVNDIDKGNNMKLTLDKLTSRTGDLIEASLLESFTDKPYALDVLCNMAIRLARAQDVYHGDIERVQATRNEDGSFSFETFTREQVTHAQTVYDLNKGREQGGIPLNAAEVQTAGETIIPLSAIMKEPESAEEKAFKEAKDNNQGKKETRLVDKGKERQVIKGDAATKVNEGATFNPPSASA